MSDENLSDESAREPARETISVIPPPWFVENFNREPMAAGLPYRGPLDPLVMLTWHMVCCCAPPPPLAICLLSGV